MRNSTRVSVVAVAALLLSVLAISPASAAPASGVWIADLAELNSSGAEGVAIVEVDTDTVTVTVHATSMSPELAHAQHIHIGGDNECPTEAADADMDGYVELAEGAPAYGPAEVSLTTEGDVSAASALEFDRMPVASADGVVSYARTFELPAGTSASELDDGVVVLHGVSEATGDPAAYESGTDPDDEATLPAACGQIDQAETPFPDVQADAFYTAPAVWAAATGLTTGYGDTGEFRPNLDLTRAEMVTFLWRFAGEPTGYSDHGFPDVPDTNPYYEQALDWAAAEGITDGYADTGDFRPDIDVNRAQMVTFLWRIVGEPTGYSDHGFPDVPDTNPYYEQALDWAAAEGITDGYGDTGEFRPDIDVTRAQEVTFLYRLNVLVGG